MPSSRQISELIGCNLKRIGNLTKDFIYPACNVFTDHLSRVEKVLLCFSIGEKYCVSYSHIEGVENLAAETQYVHFEASFGQFRQNSTDSLITIGSSDPGFTPSVKNKQVEEFINGTWIQWGNFSHMEDAESFSGYSFVNYKTELFLFGKDRTLFRIKIKFYVKRLLI